MSPASVITPQAMEVMQTIVTALITLGVLAVMAYGALTGHDTGAFDNYGAIVIGYWFGAKASAAVSSAANDGTKLPSVL